jgi:hypothetical protein
MRAGLGVLQASARNDAFILGCDAGEARAGAFGTFGANARKAYVGLHMVEEQIHSLVPGDASL